MLKQSVLVMAAISFLIGLQDNCFAQSENERRPTSKHEKGVSIIKDIVYAEAGGRRLALDLYLPRNVESPPLLVWIHGGGWHANSKSDIYLDEALYRRHGYALASIDYRLAPGAIFPAQIHDCKAAVRWLRANASKYGYDARRIGVTGNSAGGHLATLLGITADIEELEGKVGGNLDQSSRVQATVSYYGVYDFILRLKTNPARANKTHCAWLLGGPTSEKQDLARLASPAFHATPDDPPLLILHGDKDPKVKLPQAKRMHQAYKKAGLDSTLKIIPGAGHGGKKFHTDKCNKLVLEFFNRHLAGR